MDKATHTPLPCPYCGGTKFQQNTKAKGYFIKKAAQRAGKDGSNHLIRCTKCGAKGPLKHSEAEALTAWNTRAVNSHHDLIEALRGLLDEIGKSACADTILDSAAAGKAFAAIAEVEGRRV